MTIITTIQDAGYTMQIGDKTLTVHGAVLCMIGDMPANNFIRGGWFCFAKVSYVHNCGRHV